ncbi:hypothetical protein EJ04DRAFT_273561 [Polyplosphaeria fusca]|uniref:Uncharacterized protein n=1 Tax=Polyplosphaeria fusca TaxID=682080 RepID=A0A9P4V0E2_9PLEO|nr:hypothetical protein EJ04DRAFT_273561 [Polyplosphaeria fusca]
MAESESSSGASQLLKSKACTLSNQICSRLEKIPRRKLTLVGITICLNVLLWSSVATLVTTVYLIASDPSDTTNIASEVLTLTSALTSISYIFLHTIFSLKQRIWKHQRRHPSILKKTSYVAIRLAVSLCVLWLLSSGWNMIIVARRPRCLPAAPDRAGWEAGTTCTVGRFGMAMAMIALLASCSLFGMLSVVRRPFEAHLLKHGYRVHVPQNPAPAVSRRPSPTRSASYASEKYQGRVSASTHRSTPSNHSNTDVDTLDLNNSPPGSTILAPSPIRTIGMGIFTSHAQPPPLPAAYIPPRTSSRSTSRDMSPPIFHPSTSNQHLPPPPRMSSLITPSGFVPLSVPAQYSASAWRAVHPPPTSPLGCSASRSHTHLPSASQGQNFSYRNRYSRSSVSLTRPHRLSTATPVGSEKGWSSRSGSTGPGEEGRRTPGSSNGDKPSANEIAYAILNGTAIPGHQPPKGHMRRSSAPDATTGAQQDFGRKAKGWKPTLRGQGEPAETPPIVIPRSSSADLLSKFSPDSSPDNEVNLKREFERELDFRLTLIRSLPFRKSRSESPLRPKSDIPLGAGDVARGSTGSRTPREADAVARRMTYDDVKNKPLPRIAAL